MRTGDIAGASGLHKWTSLPAVRAEGGQFLLNDCGHLGDIELFPSS